MADRKEFDFVRVFKFQSDSINTSIRHRFRILASSFKFQSDSINTEFVKSNTTYSSALNSNLILLILVVPKDGTYRFTFIFKFQSDSINTRSERSTGQRITSFKFQSDSINTRVQRHL